MFSTFDYRVKGFGCLAFVGLGVRDLHIIGRRV